MGKHETAGRIVTVPGPTDVRDLGRPVRSGSGRWALAVAIIAVIALVVTLVARSRSGRGSWLVGRGGDVEYTSDACRAFAPSGRWNGSTVFLNAGHGGPDPGAVPRHGVTADTEKVFTNAIVQEALPVLRDAGFRVVLSRTGDSSVARLRPGDLRSGSLTVPAARREIFARINCANAAAADVLVSVHLNANADPRAAGAETLYNTNREFSARSRELALRLHGAVVASMRDSGWQIRDRGLETDGSGRGEPHTREPSAYGQLLELGPAAPPWFTSPSRMPGAVIEPLFLTNPDEARRVVTPAGRTAIVRGIVEGIDAYFAASG
jgi:N-acetylmuramoyl-L-alanine amidase